MDQQHFEAICQYLQRKRLTYPPSLHQLPNKQQAAAKKTFRESLKHYSIRNNTLMLFEQLIVIPESLKYLYIVVCHMGLAGSHNSEDETWKLVRTLFYWKGMREDVKLLCSNCHLCTESKNEDSCISPDILHLVASARNLSLSKNVAKPNNVEETTVEGIYESKDAKVITIPQCVLDLENSLVLIDDLTTAISSICGCDVLQVEKIFDKLNEKRLFKRHNGKKIAQTLAENFDRNEFVLKLLLQLANIVYGEDDLDPDRCDFLTDDYCLEQLTLQKHKHFWMTKIRDHVIPISWNDLQPKSYGQHFYFNVLGRYDVIAPTQCSYVVVIVELLSQLMFTLCILNPTTTEYVRAVQCANEFFQAPVKVILTDQARWWKSNNFHDFTMVTKIKHISVPSERLQQDVDRFLHQCISTYIKDGLCGDWDKFVGGIVAMYNYCVHPATGKVPFCYVKELINKDAYSPA